MVRKPTNGHACGCGCGDDEELLVEVPESPSLTEKEAQIAYHFRAIIEVLGLDMNDPSLRDTPRRVARMYLNELFAGLNLEKMPTIRLFPNTYGYHEMLVEKDIRVRSVCEHHFVPIIGVAHVAYIPRDWVVGLSKLNRVVDYFSRRPQVQERLTREIADFLEAHLGTPDVAVVIDAKHYCVSMRGIQDEASRTLTYALRGAFAEAESKHTFLRLVGL